MGLNNSSNLQNILALQEINLNEWSPAKLDGSLTQDLNRTNENTFIDTMIKEEQTSLNYTTLRHNHSQEEIDAYAVTFSSKQEVQAYFSIISWRNQCKQLVHVRYISHEIDNNAFCSNSYQFNVFFEHVKAKLTHITDFPFPENLYVLDQCLKGYEQIFKRINNFRVHEGQVCVTTLGKVRIWINSNLSKNEPQNFDILERQKSYVTQTAIVFNIIKMIDQNTDKRTQPINFLEYLKTKRLLRMKFEEAIEIVKRYAWELRVTIPNQLNSILGLINHKCQPLNSSQHQFPIEKIHSRFAPQRMIHVERPRLIQSRVQPAKIQNSITHQRNISTTSNYESKPLIMSRRIQPESLSTQRRNSLQPIRIQSRISRVATNFPNPQRQMSKSKVYSMNMNLIQPKKTIMIPQKDAQNPWKYFSNSRYEEIDPEIAADLKQFIK